MVEFVDFTLHEKWITGLQAGLGPDGLAELASKNSREIVAQPIVYVRSDQVFDLPFLIPPTTWANWQNKSCEFVDLIYRFVNLKLQINGLPFLETIGINHDKASMIALSEMPKAIDELLARPDFFLGNHGPLFLESNIDSSLGGLGTADSLSRIFQKNLEGHQPNIIRLQPLFLANALAAQLRHISNIPSGPLRLVIADWADEIDDVPWPYDRLIDDLRPLNVLASNVDQDAISVVNGRLSAASSKVDVIYRGVTPVDRLWNNWRDWKALWVADRNVPMLSSLWSVVYSSKAILGALWEAAIGGTLSSADRIFLENHVPWTWRLDTETCRRPDGGDRISTLEYTLANRHELVLKSPSDGSCKNVYVGRFLSDGEWGAAVFSALGKGHVVQQYVPPPMITNASGEYDRNSDSFLSLYYCNLSVFVFGKVAAGTCIRGTPIDGPFISCMHGAREGIAMIGDVM